MSEDIKLLMQKIDKMADDITAVMVNVAGLQACKENNRDWVAIIISVCSGIAAAFAVFKH